jgi:glucans biosynthesis protein
LLLIVTAITVAVLQHSSALSPQRKPVASVPIAKFAFDNVQHFAQQRADEPYRDRSSRLPDSIARLGYDDYHTIQFRPENALWRGQSMFEVQFFHRGSTYDHRVNITEVGDDGVLRPVIYSASQFDFGKIAVPKDLPADLGFAGFRVHYPLQRPDYKDELVAFLGASYFRVLARDQSYGASARGLAIDVASTSGEEYPYFTDFWLVHPGPLQRSLTVYALLDSPSLTGAYHFEITPGAMTLMEVTATLYPRKSVAKLGLAPMTSMYLYGKDRARPYDDYRPEVHDSDGLMMQTGGGEWLWRALSDPKTLRISSFSDEHPRGFGLTQRERDFSYYQDEDAHFQQRPSYWVAPLGDWGRGTVELVEVPTDEAIHDNMIASWVPKTSLQPHKPFNFSYLLTTYTQAPSWPPGGRVVATRTTPTHGRDNSRRMLIDFAGGDLDALLATQPVKAVLGAHNGDVDNVTVQRLAENGVWRVSFRVQPRNSQAVDLHCYLSLYGEALTETWMYLWTP